MCGDLLFYNSKWGGEDKHYTYAKALVYKIKNRPVFEDGFC